MRAAASARTRRPSARPPHAPARRRRFARRRTRRPSPRPRAVAACSAAGRRLVGPRQRRAALNAAEARRVGAGLVVAVEERAERVVVGLLDRVVLVVVAARAADREPQERGAERVVRALDHVLGFVLRVDRAVLGRALADAQERRREDLLARRVRQQVAGELPRAELVERPVARERVDDPVAPRPEQPVVVVVEEAVGLAEAREVEPVVGHALGVGGRGEQAIDEALVGVGRRVRDERVDLLERRRQARSASA